MGTKIIPEIIFYLWGTVSASILIVLTAIQIRRLINKLKWVYNDWLIITWIFSYLWMFIFMILIISFSLTKKDALEKYKWISYSIMWFFLRMFEVTSMSYPILLIIYYTKLSDLRNDKPFNEVKRSINRLELAAIFTILSILMLYLIVATLPNIVIYSENNWEDIFDKHHKSGSFSLPWKISFHIRTAAFYFYELLNIVLLVIQIMIFRHIKKTMKHKLHYYYELAMKGLKILLFSHLPFLISNTLLNAGFLFGKNDYNFYL